MPCRCSGICSEKNAGPEAWGGLDFMVDRLFNGHRFRSLTIADNIGRERWAIEDGQSLMRPDIHKIRK